MSNLTLLSGLSIILDEDPIINATQTDDHVEFVHLSGKSTFVNNISGKDGTDGVNGKDGIDGTNGKDGLNGSDGVGISDFYIVNDTKTESIYELSLTSGQTHQIEIRHGKDGKRGKDGVGVSTIEKISTVGVVDNYRITLSNDSTFEFSISNGKDGLNGSVGLSAYDIAVNNGFIGDEKSWLKSLRGKDGNGVSGADGVGVTGAFFDNYGNLKFQLSDGRLINTGSSTLEALKPKEEEYEYDLYGKEQTITFSGALVSYTVYDQNGRVALLETVNTNDSITLYSNVILDGHILVIRVRK